MKKGIFVLAVSLVLVLFFGFFLCQMFLAPGKLNVTLTGNSLLELLGEAGKVLFGEETRLSPPCNDGNSIDNDGCTDGFIDTNFLDQPIWECAVSGQPCSYIPPIGIPKPTFGIEENVANVYGSEDYYTHYVDNANPSCSDAGDGTPAVPRCAIPTSLSAGDVVYVAGGTYSANHWDFTGAGTESQPVFLRGNPGNKPVLVVTANNDNHVYGSYFIVENFIYDQLNKPGTELAVKVMGGANYISIRHCEVRNSSGATAGGLVAEDSHDVVFFKNSLHHLGDVSESVINDPDGDGRADFHAFVVGAPVSNIWLLDNEMHTMSGSGLQVNGDAVTTHHVFVGRNTIHDNLQSGLTVKHGVNIIFSQNNVHDIITTAWSPSKGLAYQYGPVGLWYIYNNISCNGMVYGVNGPSSNNPQTGSVYFIGNLITGCDAGMSFWGQEATVAYAVGNTFYNNGAGIRYENPPRINMENNIFSNTAGFDLEVFGGVGSVALASTAKNNLFDAGSMSVSWGGVTYSSAVNFNNADSGDGRIENNLEGNPMFVNAPGDLHLQSGSDAIDSGMESDVYQTFYQDFSSYYNTLGSSEQADIHVDFDWNFRPQPSEGEWDIGAYEFLQDVGCTANSDCDSLDNLPCVDYYCDIGGTDTCVASYPTSSCNDNNECTSGDSCSLGACFGTAVTDGTSCTSDGLFCNGVESCQVGVCVGAGSPCLTGFSCDEEIDECVELPEPTGEVLWMKFDDSPLDGVLDSSTYGNNGDCTGGCPTFPAPNSKFGAAYEFNGLNNFVAIASPSNELKPSNELALSVWINASVMSDTRAHIMSMGDHYGLRIEQDTGGQIAFWKHHASGFVSLRSGTGNNYFDGLWHHVAAVQDNSGMHLYVDGILVGENTNAEPFVYTGEGTAFEIGRFGNQLATNGDAVLYDYQGLMDDLRVYNSSLSPEEVLALYYGQGESCGNQICEAGETVETCPQDCDCYGGSEEGCEIEGWEEIRALYTYSETDELGRDLAASRGINTLLTPFFKFEEFNSNSLRKEKFAEFSTYAKENNLSFYPTFHFVQNWSESEVTNQKSIYYNGTGLAEASLIPFLDRAYWGNFTEFLKGIALADNETSRVDGVFIDFELYYSPKPEVDRLKYFYYSYDGIYDDETFGEFYSQLATPPPEPTWNERRNWLISNGLLDDYVIFIRAKAKELAQQMKEEIYAMNPDFKIGYYQSPMWIEEEWKPSFITESRYRHPLFFDLNDGWSKYHLPILFSVDLNQSYLPNPDLGQTVVPSELKETGKEYLRYERRDTAENHNLYYVFGIYLRYYSPDEFEEELFNISSRTNGYWIFSSMPFFRGCDSLPGAGYRLPTYCEGEVWGGEPNCCFRPDELDEASEWIPNCCSGFNQARQDFWTAVYRANQKLDGFGCNINGVCDENENYEICPEDCGAFYGMAVESVAQNGNEVTVNTTGARYVLTSTGMEMYRRIDPATNSYNDRLVATLSFAQNLGTLSVLTDINKNKQYVIVDSDLANFTFNSDSLFFVEGKGSFQYTHTNLVADADWNKGSYLNKMWTDGYGGSLHGSISGVSYVSGGTDSTTIQMNTNGKMMHMVYPPKLFDFERLYGENARPFTATPTLTTFTDNPSNFDILASYNFSVLLLWNSIYDDPNVVGERSAPKLLDDGRMGYEINETNGILVSQFIADAHGRGFKVTSYLSYPSGPRWNYPAGHPLAGQHQPVNVTLQWMREFQEEWGFDGWYFDNGDAGSIIEDYNFMRQVRRDVGDEGIIEHHDSVDVWGGWNGLRAIMVDAYVDYILVGETSSGADYGGIADVDDVNNSYFRYYSSGYGLSQAFGDHIRKPRLDTALSEQEKNRVMTENLHSTIRSYGPTPHADWLSHALPFYNQKKEEYLSGSFNSDVDWPLNKVDSWFREPLNLQITWITGTSVNISWETSEPTDSVVDYTNNSVWWDTPYYVNLYGRSGPTGTVSDPELKTKHSALISFLNPNQFYEFRIRSRNQAGDVLDELTWGHFFNATTGVADGDGDNLPDDWEMFYFGIMDYGDNDDNDFDGLNNLGEYTNGGNPLVVDSDCDGVSDGQEVSDLTNLNDWYDALNPVCGNNICQNGETISTCPQDCEQGIIAYWNFDCHGKVWDGSGNGRDGTPRGADWLANGGYDGKGAFNFKGGSSPDYLSLDESIPMQTNFTISAWIKKDKYDDFDMIIGGSVSNYFAVHKSGNRLILAYSNNTGYPTCYSNWNAMNNTDWHHVAVVAGNSSTIKLYIDGADVTSVTCNHPKDKGGFNFNSELVQAKDGIGAFYSSNPPGYGNPMNGIIDELRIYNRTLNDSEIMNLATIPVEDCGNEICADGIDNDCDDETDEAPCTALCSLTPENKVFIWHHSWMKNTSIFPQLKASGLVTHVQIGNLDYNEQPTSEPNTHIIQEVRDAGLIPIWSRGLWFQRGNQSHQPFAQQFKDEYTDGSILYDADYYAWFLEKLRNESIELGVPLTAVDGEPYVPETVSRVKELIWNADQETYENVQDALANALSRPKIETASYYYPAENVTVYNPYLLYEPLTSLGKVSITEGTYFDCIPRLNSFLSSGFDVAGIWGTTNTTCYRADRMGSCIVGCEVTAPLGEGVAIWTPQTIFDNLDYWYNIDKGIFVYTDEHEGFSQGLDDYCDANRELCDQHSYQNLYGESCNGLDDDCDGVIDEGTCSVCGDHICTGGETFLSCPEDCDVGDVCRTNYSSIDGNLLLNPYAECDNDGNSVPDNWNAGFNDSSHILSWVDSPTEETGRVLKSEFTGEGEAKSFFWLSTGAYVEPETWYEFSFDFASEDLEPLVNSTTQEMIGSTRTYGVTLSMYDSVGNVFGYSTTNLLYYGPELSEWNETARVYQSYVKKEFDGWHNLKKYIKTPADVSRLRVITRNYPIGKGYYDNFSLKEMPADFEPYPAKESGSLNFLQYNEEDFFPIVLYGFPRRSGTEVDLIEVKDAGFNAIRGEYTYQGIDVDASGGLQAQLESYDLVAFSRALSMNTWINNSGGAVPYTSHLDANTLIDIWKNNERMIAYSAPDEQDIKPWMRGAFIQNLDAGNEMRTFGALRDYVMQEDPDALMIFDYGGAYFDSESNPYTGIYDDLADYYFPKTDIIMHTVNTPLAYPVYGAEINLPLLGKVGKMIDRDVAETEEREMNKTLFAYALGTYSWSGWNETNPLRTPYNLQRFQIYEQLIHGATGVLWYLPHQDQPDLTNTYADYHWTQMKTLSQEMSLMKDILLEKEFYDDWEVSDERIDVMMKEHNNKIYLLTASTHYEDLYDLSVSLGSEYEIFSVKALNERADGSLALGENRSIVPVDSQSFVDDFVQQRSDIFALDPDAPGYAVHVYEIEYLAQDYCTDEDGDRYSLEGIPTICNNICSGQTCLGGGDCDDDNINVHPGAQEVCNGIDDNCILGIDEGGDSLCNDGVDCTVDVCAESECQFTADHGFCNDGDYCNGVELCAGVSGSGCVTQDVPDCSPFNATEIATCTNPLYDGIDMTWDFRAEFLSQCYNVPGDYECSLPWLVTSECNVLQCGLNGAVCDLVNPCPGLQVCDSGSCSCVGVECDSHDDCQTGEYCDSVGVCQNRLDNGANCNVEVVSGGSQNYACLSDACNQDYAGGNYCSSSSNVCVHLAGIVTEYSSGETAPDCYSSLYLRVCNNGVWGQGTNCDNGLFCDGAETCSVGICHQGAGCTDDEVSCTVCNEEIDECNVPDDSLCTGGLVCDELLDCVIPGTCNGISLESGEECDGIFLGGENCISLGYPAGGILGCFAFGNPNACEFNTSGCSILPAYSEFNGDTTNFAGEGNVSNVSNSVLEVAGKGKIEFLQDVNFERLDINKYVTIETNRIGVNLSGPRMSNLNVPSVITFYGVNFEQPKILVDGATCASDVCEIMAYTKGVLLRVRVPGFSVYSVIGGEYCGDGSCSNGETCESCAYDCGTCSGGGNGGRRVTRISAKPQCGDGIDNDLDGLIDYPADPGCASLSDDLELNFGGLKAETCIEVWVCGDWSYCESGAQTRDCSDTNDCGTVILKPDVERECKTIRVGEGIRWDIVFAAAVVMISFIALVVAGIVLVNSRKKAVRAEELIRSARMNHALR